MPRTYEDGLRDGEAIVTQTSNLWWARHDGELAARFRRELQTDTRVGKSGELVWISNGSPVPMDVFKTACQQVPEPQEAAIEAHTTMIFARYRDSAANHARKCAGGDADALAIEAERHAERRAAFGPGVKLVDVISGEKSRT